MKKGLSVFLSLVYSTSMMGFTFSSMDSNPEMEVSAAVISTTARTSTTRAATRVAQTTASQNTSTVASTKSTATKQTTSRSVSTTRKTATTAKNTTSTTTTTTTATTLKIGKTTPSVDPLVRSREITTEDQKNSIAWLNYLAMLTQEINSSQNSRLFLEEAYSSLINNSNPENVNEETLSYLDDLLDTIEKYRMIATKRERLQYIYEQNKAVAIKDAVPSPVALLSLTQARSKEELIAAIVYMAIDSGTSYVSSIKETELEYLQDGWELDDAESENLHNSRKLAFNFMVQTVNDYDLPGKLALNENAIKSFVDCKNNTNTNQQIQFLKSKESTYSAFGSYWILCAQCYYNNKDYQKCLDSISIFFFHNYLVGSDSRLCFTLSDMTCIRHPPLRILLHLHTTDALSGTGSVRDTGYSSQIPTMKVSPAHSGT